ncbi:RagB/SusD family nutrient uptake outer membrane protein [Geofilum sp. OHC36d9]|uniref:RagB/SusD family nutrient uptake outer membrane protein n=1 Tax=Geofilum sp. OHC36d9 TaxID=3458413 RepID=UPI0040345CBD
MKKYIIRLSYICLLIGLMTSCMDLDPLDSMGDNITWSSADNFQLFANQFYAYTRDFKKSDDYNAYNGFSDGPHSDFRSDLIATSSINTYSQGTNVIPTEDKNYSETYKRIYYTNLLLEKAKSYSDETEIAVPIAEAKFFRAYLHFELVQLYGDVILLTKPLDIDSYELNGERDDRRVVIDQIIADLKDAALSLPATASEDGRLTQAAAYAFLSRVALYEGTWQKFHNNNTSRSSELLTIARDAALNVMDGTYELFYDETLGVESYRYMFILEDAAQCNPAGLTTSDNKEYILAHRHYNGDKLGVNISHAALGNVIYPTSKLANMYLCSDGLPVEVSDLFGGYSTTTTEFQNRDNRMSTSLIKHGANYWNNDGAWRTSWTDDDLESCLTMDVRSNGGYQNQKWATERQVADEYETYDYPVIRYAEVLLNYAEAEFELNGAITDEQLDASLNLVRQRVNPDMPKLSNSFVATYGLDMQEEIRRERTIELYLEGFRIDDLKRWAIAEDEMPKNQLGVMFTGTWFETNWTKQARSINSDGRIILYDNRTWADKNYLYPLPSDEVQLNPNLGQNPGWE